MWNGYIAYVWHACIEGECGEREREAGTEGWEGKRRKKVRRTESVRKSRESKDGLYMVVNGGRKAAGIVEQ